MATEGSYAKFRIRNKEALKGWILRRLGYPSVSVEITEDQIDYCITDAIEEYTKWVHYDEKYLALNLTSYVEGEGFTLPEEVVAVFNLYEDSTLGLNGFFEFGSLENILLNVGGQAGITGAQGLLGGWMDYECAMQAVKFGKQMVQPYTYTYNYNEQSKKLVLDPDPKLKRRSGYIVLGCSYVRDDEYLYGESWVKKLALAYAKEQVGAVRAKFGGVPLPGGGSLNTDMAKEGADERKALMEEIQKMNPPTGFFFSQ